ITVPSMSTTPVAPAKNGTTPMLLGKLIEVLPASVGDRRAVAVGRPEVHAAVLLAQFAVGPRARAVRQVHPPRSPGPRHQREQPARAVLGHDPTALLDPVGQGSA